MYFKKFPKIEVDVYGNGTKIMLTDITKRVRFYDMVRKNNVLLDYYDVKSGETPEYIADTYYGDVQLHWVVLLTNNITDVYDQWPMAVEEFEQYVYDKYEDVNATHHWEFYQESGDTTKVIEIPNDSANAVPVDAIEITNYDYEERLQEQRRRIRLIKPEYIPKIKQELQNRMRGY